MLKYYWTGMVVRYYTILLKSIIISTPVLSQLILVLSLPAGLDGNTLQTMNKMKLDPLQKVLHRNVTS